MNTQTVSSLKRRLKVAFCMTAAIFLSGISMYADGATTTYTYDSLNRLTTADYSNGLVINFTYDAAGNRLTQVISSGVTQYAVTPSAGANGTISPNAAQPVNSGGSVSFTATPASSAYVVDQWLVNASIAQTGGTSFTLSNVTASATVQVTFKAAPVTGLFSDDFNDNSIDSSKWSISGSTVTEAGQIMQVLTTVTDQGGSLTSKPFAVSNNGVITITRKVFLHRDVRNGHYFTGRFGITIGTLPTFGICYEDYDYVSATDIQKHGFFMTRNGAGAHNPGTQTDVSTGAAAIWDTWFDEKITYDPATGAAEYFINNVSQITFNVGVLPASASPTMTLFFQAYGWFTGHQQLFDDLAITQGTQQAVSYTVTPSAGGNGSISPGTVQTVSSGGSAAFTATPNGGYVVDQWLVNSAVVQTGGNSYTASNVTANTTVQVAFKAQTYTITTSSSPVAGGGTSGGGTVNSGSSVTVLATSNAGYSFVNWTEGGIPVSATASYNFTANASRTLVANFTPITYTITSNASPLPGGGISGGGTVNSGSSVTVLATSNAGYSFVNWTEGGIPVSATASYNFTANASRTLVANFATTTSNNANLASLLPSAGSLSPTFASGTLNYTATVAKSALYYTVTPSVAQAGATVTVNGTAVTSGSASGHIPLTIGSNNVITTIVTAPDGFTTQTFTLTVTRVSTAPVLIDLTGSGKPDLLFQNTGTGQLHAWFLDGTGSPINFGTGSGILSADYLYGGSLPGWQLAGVADVNGDGIPDLVFQHTGSGQVYAWFLDGTGALINFATGSGIKGSGYLYGGGLIGWQLAAIVDVNGDGIPDLVFQNTSTGQVYAWFLDGTGASIDFGTGSGIKGTGYLYGGNLVGWRLAGIADVNGDGIADLVFQNTGTGQVYAWFLDGTGAPINFATGIGIKRAGYLYGGGLPGWQLASISDVNGDGIPDLVFQNTGTGQIYAWFLNGTGASINFGTGSGIKSTGYLYGGSLLGWQLH